MIHVEIPIFEMVIPVRFALYNRMRDIMSGWALKW
jgi:hypothetical protein